MTSLRVLLLNENKGSGGAEIHTLHLAQELHQRNLLLFVVSRPDSWLAQACRAQKVPFRSCSFCNEIDMLSVFKLWRRIKAGQPQILHCMAHRDLVASALAQNLPGLPKTWLVKAEHSFPDPKLSPLFRWAYKQCQAVVSVSTPAQEAIRETLDPESHQAPTQFRVVANGIPLKPLYDKPAPTPAQPLHIGVLSGLRKGKGHLDFLKAAASAEFDRPVKWSLAGDGPLRTELELAARDLGLEVTFLGQIEDPDSYLRTLDLAVLPSHVETFSLVALEALSLGLPLIAADSQGVSTLCRQEQNLYPKGDLEALRHALETFCADPQGFKKKAQDNATFYRQNYSTSVMTDNYVEFYRDLIR